MVTEWEHYVYITEDTFIVVVPSGYTTKWLKWPSTNFYHYFSNLDHYIFLIFFCFYFLYGDRMKTLCVYNWIHLHFCSGIWLYYKVAKMVLHALLPLFLKFGSLLFLIYFYFFIFDMVTEWKYYVYISGDTFIVLVASGYTTKWLKWSSTHFYHYFSNFDHYFFLIFFFICWQIQNIIISLEMYYAMFTMTTKRKTWYVKSH